MNPALLNLYPVLLEIDANTRQNVFKNVQLLSIPAGTVLFDERQPCLGFPFLLTGAVKVIKAAPNGRVLPLYRVLPGETCIVTSSCLLGHVEYNARGETEGETSLIFLPRVQFDALLDTPPFRSFIFRLFSERIVGLMQLVEEVAFRKLDQRLASLLLGKGQTLNTTHQALADELGSVREIISRLLKDLAEQGLVELGREQITVLERRIAAM